MNALTSSLSPHVVPLLWMLAVCVGMRHRAVASPAGIQLHSCAPTGQCWRRRAFAEVYAAQAQQMAERMGKLRVKEVSQREAFRVQVHPA